MKLTKPGLMLGVATALLVVAFVVWDSRKISPGALSAVHAQKGAVAEDECQACHGDSGTPMATACGTCHADVLAQVQTKRGLHGQLSADVSRCGSCHSEHHGPEFQISGSQTFAQAGIADRAAFRHEGLSFALVGAHIGLDCKRCHEHADDAVLVRGAKRFIGKDQSCATCHKDPHEGRMPACASCHGQSEPFEKVAAFVHPASFALTGAHSKPGCLECHAKGSTFAIEASGVMAGSGKATRETRTCEQCHASPHATDFVARAASALAMASGAVCVSCHTNESTSFRGRDAQLRPELHALSGFALDAPHDTVKCEQCHAVGPRLVAAPPGSSPASAFHALHPGRSPEDCKACHADPHAGQFDVGAFAEKNCLACHARTAFAPAAFTVSAHETTQFALTGSHAAVSCAECHKQPSPTAPRQFHGTSTACSSCHADAHSGFFDRPNVPAIFQKEEGCARCHATDTFGEVRNKTFDHELWTGFALTGEHAQAACTSCHLTMQTPDATGRAFGRVAETFKGSPQVCATCHVDVHLGAFDRKGSAPRTASGEGCARCHDTKSFVAAGQAFAHASWTSFALTGAHVRADCESCHETRAKADANGRRFGLVADRFPGAADDCRTCHIDVHTGSFDRPGLDAQIDGRRGCERCHTTESFNGAAKENFDHKRWTGFALDGAHTSATCQSCHAPTAKDTASGHFFGKARGTTCQSCHEDAHVGQFTVKGSTDCARCHTTATTFAATRFDHQRDSRFALDATHAPIACSRCHLPTPLSDGSVAVRYKPLGTQCGDCHAPERR